MPRVVRCLPALWFVAIIACNDARPLGELTRGRDDRLRAVLALHASECEGNTAMLTLFDLARVRSGIALEGVVLIEPDPGAGRLVRRELRANDVAAPLLTTSADTRRALDSVTRGATPALVIIDPRQVDVRVLRAPQSPAQLLALTDTLITLAVRAKR